jgi:uncharacterized protein (DUF488 family)
VIATVGHSTRTLDEFVSLLKAHGIRQLADVRSVPRSRRHPHFSGDALSESLSAVAVAYRHFPRLGGLRQPRRDSQNTAWRNEGFRGYADYMETPAFAAALDELLSFAGLPRRHPVLETPERAGGVPGAAAALGCCCGCGTPPTAIMCAEAVWWRCHRQLLADALVARGVEVRHLTSRSTAPPHTLTDFALVEAERVSYRRLI